MGWKDRLAALLPQQQNLPWRDQLKIALAGGVSVLLVAMVSQYFLDGTGVPVLVMSMGASAVLLFGLPGSPVSQPWPLLAGHWVAAAIGVVCARTIHQPGLASAVALGLSLLAMFWLRCFHPPGGAITLFAVLGGERVHAMGFGFLWLPLGLNLLLMLAAAFLLNNYFLRRPWPAPRSVPNPHHSKDANPLARLGLTGEDIAESVREFGTMLDVSQTDLATLFRGAQLHAAERRLGEIRCCDIMSRNIISVEFGTQLDEAWRLLYTHKVNALPVLDRYGYVIGIVTLIDFLKAAQLNKPDNLRQRIREFLTNKVRSSERSDASI
jgi:CBS domain-containing membrane protein